MHISLINIGVGKAQKVTISLGDIKAGKITSSILKSTKKQNYNTFKKPKNIAPVAFNWGKLNGTELEVTLQLFSITALKLK